MDVITKIKSRIGVHLQNVRGWKTNRKIIVFESDDWGSIRMPSKEVYNIMLRKGYPVDIRPFEKYDSLERDEDIEALFEVLKKFRDKDNNHPVFTANTIMTNPNFDLIKENGFEKYYAEHFTDTLKKYPESENVLNLIKQGITENIFLPQYHGHSHFNINEWMKLLKTGSQDERFCFDYGMVGIPPKTNPEMGNQLMVALKFSTSEEFEQQKKNVLEGAQIFERIFGYKSKSFIAPVYTWNSEIEKELKKVGVDYIQGGRFQKEPHLPSGNIKIKKHYTGKVNKNDQIYLVRNIFFEPSVSATNTLVDNTLKRIEIAFMRKKPAIISTHRLNYIGRIHPENRKRNLNMLAELLSKLTIKWQEVEYMTSVQLGDLINEEHNNENSNS